MLQAGADKVWVNTAAVQRPELVARGRRAVRQPVYRRRDRRAPRATDGGWEVYTHGGRRPTGIDAVEWAARAEALGAGEILLTSHGRRRHAGRLRPGAHRRGLSARWASRSSPRAAPARSPTSTTRSPTGWPTPCSSPRSSTTARTRSARRRSTWQVAGSRSGPRRPRQDVKSGSLTSSSEAISIPSTPGRACERQSRSTSRCRGSGPGPARPSRSRRCPRGRRGRT